ncbi:MAG: carboxypeptidase regulatory-like domain-containing protein [Candidatus Magnetomorum sp.]|nr:carboxypeptidase regulatory-like domain-containing protein [Candidatus Magnetomorum sp.]
MKTYIKDFLFSKKERQPAGIKSFFIISFFLCMVMVTGQINTAFAVVQSSPTIVQHSYSDYVPGGMVQMTCTIDRTQLLSALGVKVILPEGWTYELQSMSGPDLPDNDKSVENGVEFIWAHIPDEDSIEFSYMLRATDEVSGNQTIKAELLYRVNNEEEGTVSANPVTVQQVAVNGFHSLSDIIDEQTRSVDNIIFYNGDLTALGIRISMPENTAFVQSDNTSYQSKFINDSTVELFWNTPPESPVTFSYLIKRTGAVSKNANIVTQLFYRVADGLELEKNVYPDPLGFPYDDSQFIIHASTSGDGGEIYPEGEIVVLRGQSITLTQTTADGYKFSGWLVDGSIDTGAPFYQYIFVHVSDNHLIKALFERIEYQVTIIKGANGKITSTTGDNKVFHGEDIQFSIDPDEGFEIDTVRVNGQDYDLHGDNVVEFKNVIDNQQRLTVTFKPRQYEIIVEAGDHGRVITQDNHNFVFHGEDKTYIIVPDNDYVIGEVRVNGQLIVLSDNTYTFRNVVKTGHKLYVSFDLISNYTISAIAEGNGRISPQGDISIEHGKDALFSFIPDANNIIKDVIIDGISYGPLEKFHFKYVTDTHTIKAIFVLREQFEISATASEGGVVSPDYATVFKGDKQIFTITPSNAYRIKDVRVDGISQGRISTYTFWDVQKNHDISADFEKIENIFTVTVDHSEGGIVEPSGMVKVNQGDPLVIINQPDYGYIVENVFIDNESKGPLSKVVIENVQKNLPVYIKFKSVAQKPQASFVFNPTSGLAPLKVTFKDQSQDYIEQWLWSFGDGGKSADKNPIHTYSSPGEYTVSLMVSGPGGTDTKILAKAIDVQKTDPIKVTFIASATRGIAPLDVQFYNLTQGSIDSWLWDFGDGITSTEKNPIHVYTRTGNYTVKLVADTIYSTQKQDYIQISGRTIHGRVSAGDVNGNETGESLAGYTVEAHIRLNTLLMPLFVSSTLTDENGNYTLFELPSTSNLIISAWPNFDDRRYMGEYYKDASNAFKAKLLSTKTGNLFGIDFVLTKTPILGVHGQVVKDSIGLENIEVSIFSVSTFFYQTTLTDSEGYYTFTSLRDATDYRVYIWSEDHQSELYYHLPEGEIVGEDAPTFSVLTWDLARTVTPHDPVVEKIDILMGTEQTQSGMIQGNVRLKEGGAPVKGLWVNAWSDKLKTGNGAITDASGAYTIVGLLISDNFDDGYIVEIDSSNDMYPYQAYDQTEDRSLAKKVMPDSDNINFYLKNGNTIYGHVSDADGHPIKDVKIQTWSLSKIFNNSATTDASGMYSLPNLPPSDDYVVAAFSDKYPVQYFFHKEKRKNADYVDLTEGNVYNIDFRLDEGAIIEGNISIQNKEGVISNAGPGIFVNIWSNTTGRLHTEKTDENSHYRFAGLESNATDYIVYVWEPDYLRSYYSETAENNTVHHWNEASGVQPGTLVASQSRNIVLFSGYEIRGKITYNEQAVANVKVEAWNEDNETYVDDVSTASLSRGYNFCLTGLPPGIYEVRIYHDKYVDDVKTISIIDTDITDIEFELKTYARSISGKITGLEQGEVLFVKARPKKSTNIKMIKVLGTGNVVDYMITGLEPLNKYIVDIVPSARYPYIAYDNQATEQKATLIDLRNEDATDIDLQLLQETVSISGNIIFPEIAISKDSVWVYAYSSQLNAESQTQVVFTNNLSVPYVISGLRPSNDYVVSVASNIYKQHYFENAISFDQAKRIDTTDDITDDSVNFELAMGTCIEGVVYAENGKGKANVRVEAWSKKAQSLGYVTTLSNGAYRIGGLNKTDDYIVYISYNNTTFYYQSDRIVSDIEKATKISTLQVNPSNINFYLIKTETISGTVRDSKGRRIENVIVSARAISSGAGNGCKTDKKGYYIITDLPSGDDYQVSVTPSGEMPYIGQVKTDIKTGTSNVDFVLMTGYMMSGTVQSWQGNPVADGVVELSSKDGRQQYKSITDSDGHYEMNGIPEGSGYYLLVSAPDRSTLVDFYEKGVLIFQNIEKDISLGPASQIDGYVSIADATGLGGERPAVNVMITLFSSEKSFWTSALTNKDGYFILSNIPDADDYIIKSISDAYIDHVEMNRSSGETVNFMIDPALIIQGMVLNAATGTGMKGALIEVYYKTDQLRKVARADSNGRFMVSGLDTKINGEMVKEYIVVAKYTGYPDAKAIWKIDQLDSLMLKMARSDQNVIKGTVKDVQLKAPPENVVVFVRLYNFQSKGGLIQTSRCESDGSFRFEGLSITGRYQLKFIAQNSALESSKLWLGAEKPSIGRLGAAVVKTSDGDIDFVFNEVWTDE